MGGNCLWLPCRRDLQSPPGAVNVAVDIRAQVCVDLGSHFSPEDRLLGCVAETANCFLE